MDNFFNITTTSTSVTLSFTGFGLVPISGVVAYALSIGIKLIFEIITERNRCTENNMREHSRLFCFPFQKKYRESLRDNVNDEMEHDCLGTLYGEYNFLRKVFFRKKMKKPKLLHFQYQNKVVGSRGEVGFRPVMTVVFIQNFSSSLRFGGCLSHPRIGPGIFFRSIF